MIDYPTVVYFIEIYPLFRFSLAKKIHLLFEGL